MMHMQIAFNNTTICVILHAKITSGCLAWRRAFHDHPTPPLMNKQACTTAVAWLGILCQRRTTPGLPIGQQWFDFN